MGCVLLCKRLEVKVVLWLAWDCDNNNSNVAALFMLDCGTQLYLWQGWIPSDSEAEDPESPSAVTTGSGKVRWHAERRAAMQTILEYRKAKYGKPVPAAKLIWAGNETQEFINYFPQWVVNHEVSKTNREVSNPSHNCPCKSKLQVMPSLSRHASKCFCLAVFEDNSDTVIFNNYDS